MGKTKTGVVLVNKLTKCDKAVLAATQMYAKQSGAKINLRELVNGALESRGFCYDKDNNFIAIGVLIPDASSSLSAIRNVITEEQERANDVFRDLNLTEKANQSLDIIQEKLGHEWVFTSGPLEGTVFSLKGQEGRSKLIFSLAMSKLLNLGYQNTGRINIKEEARGSHLKGGDYVRMYLLRIHLDSHGYTSGTAEIQELFIYFTDSSISTREPQTEFVYDLDEPQYEQKISIEEVAEPDIDNDELEWEEEELTPGNH